MNEQVATLVSEAATLFQQLTYLEDDDRMEAINQIRLALHEHSPMKEHPVDCVVWVKQEEVQANSYNPNAVAPPEMALLERSIVEDGYTQPVVGWRVVDGKIEIVDGFHRWLIAQMTPIYARLQGRLPVAIIDEKKNLSDRMASTIRHNRARGEHSIELMQTIVAELVEAGMSDRWIMKHIGMDVDELLRLKQLTGLAALFRKAEFSHSWQVHDLTHWTESEEPQAD